MNMEIFVFSLQCYEYGNVHQRAVHQIYNTVFILWPYI